MSKGLRNIFECGYMCRAIWKMKPLRTILGFETGEVVIYFDNSSKLFSQVPQIDFFPTLT